MFTKEYVNNITPSDFCHFYRLSTYVTRLGTVQFLFEEFELLVDD